MMNYLLIFDNRRKISAEVRIRKACVLYEERYHAQPGVVLVHASDMPEPNNELSVLVCTGESQGIQVNPGYFWLGPI